MGRTTQNPNEHTTWEQRDNALTLQPQHQESLERSLRLHDDDEVRERLAREEPSAPNRIQDERSKDWNRQPERLATPVRGKYTAMWAGSDSPPKVARSPPARIGC